MLCSEWSLVNRQTPLIKIMPLRCKCWHCEECRPLRTWRLLTEARAGKPDLFITLTWRWRASVSPDQAAVLLAHAWRSARAAYLREFGPKSLPFLAVFERTKKGQPHIHIVARCKWLDHEWLSKKMGKLIRSPNVWIERIHHKSKVAAYVTKYIGKNPERFVGVKRYWRSMDYLLPPDPEDEPLRERSGLWEIHQLDWRSCARAFALGALWVRWGKDEATVLPWRPP